MRKTLFNDKYVGYHTFGLLLDNVTVAQDLSGLDPSPNTPDPDPNEHGKEGRQG